ncbi:MAG TPA: aspartate kinase, partial [Candidatus Cloacimonas sp.]|nr:aspartate kinase [Candidatus Cloacimonas sp.]
QVSDMLTLCNYEIYKSFINAGFLELFVETKYETEVDYFLQDRGIEPKNKESNLAFVNLVGLGLGHDPAFLASVIENSKNYNILRSYNNEQSIELLLPNNHLSEVVQKLHTIYIEEKQ